MVCKKGVLRNFAKFTGRHLYQKLFFNKAEGLACKFIKKSLWHRYFPVNFAKFLRMPFSESPPPVTASKLSRLNCNIKKTLKGFNDECFLYQKQSNETLNLLYQILYGWHIVTHSLHAWNYNTNRIIVPCYMSRNVLI